MHLARTWIFAVVATVSFLLAPSASAAFPPFYVTFISPSGSSPRIAGALLSTTSPTANPKRTGNAHIEIDDWLGSAGNIANFAGSGTALEVKIEYTTADARGQESVNLIAKLGDVRISKWSVSFTSGAPAKLGQSVDIAFQTATTQAPPNQPSSAVPSTPPQIARRMVALALPPAHVETDYLHASAIKGDIKSGPHADDTAITSLSFTATWPTTASGMSAGKMSLGAVTVKKAMSASNAFSAAHSTNTVLWQVMQRFDQSVGGNDVARFSIELYNATVSGDSTQVSAGGQVETIEFKAHKIDFTDSSTGMSGTLVQLGLP